MMSGAGFASDRGPETNPTVDAFEFVMRLDGEAIRITSK